MKHRRSAFKSCALTILVSASVVLLLLGCLLGLFCLGSWLSGIPAGNWQLLSDYLNILAAFGNGHSVQGSVVIALTCGGAIGLFDLLLPYRYEHLS
ncbi:MAG: hypothetical protein AAGG51_18625 [Cyanobacteria bacterium P01_G01_bin.54]